MSRFNGDKKRKPKIKTTDIRQSFLSYFKAHDHRIVPSSPVIPFDDPTLLFINAGMNQFKDVFTGRRRLEYRRAASVQKCIRAGGKHNDLDNVGFTARHHTFFEMLGNFSFGDYFKEQAIAYAWEWLTKELALPIDRLYVTVYETDDEAYDLWKRIAPQLNEARLLRFGKKDNYWAMGDTGPCGPCSEIHFDRGEKFGTGPDDVVNGETERFVEIWNLVFMQYERQPDGNRIPLPKPSVDTGAGLERLTAVMQGVDSNYEIDIFKSIIKAVSDITKSKYKDHVASHHVVADHLRALVFAIADGAGVSNEGRGYVLRRILRRAARHGRILDMHEPFIYRLVPVLVTLMGDAYPEIKEKQKHIESVIQSEEESFCCTLETGCQLFDGIAKKVTSVGSTIVDGSDVFRLYDTYGFPYDLTEIMAGERGLTLDRDGFDKAMTQQKEQSRADARFALEGTKEFIDKLEQNGLLDEKVTEFLRLENPEQEVSTGSLLAIGHATGAAVVLDRTPFYVESGGQVSDTGWIRGQGFSLEVTAMYNHRDYYIHVGRLTRGHVRDIQGEVVTVKINAERRWDIMRNHTATHLAHAALRQVLGQHIRQSGSYVGPDRLRFDFSHHQPMTPAEITQVEKIVNGLILKGTPVTTQEMDVDSARKSGAVALFGEKYGDTVRVVSVEDFSRELCGGTHVDNVSQIGPFFITLETGVASGVRRLEAITGSEAQKFMLQSKQFRQNVASLVGRPETDALAGVQQLRDNNLTLQKEIKKIRSEMFAGGVKAIGEEFQAGPVSGIMHNFKKTDRDTMASWIDAQKASHETIVALGLGEVNGKLTFMSSASPTAIADYDVHMGKLTQSVLAQYGGRGGGKEAFAQGTVAPGTIAEDLFETARLIISKEATQKDG
ncbi:MAG: alanine--tRNA ligase [bacterium]